MPHDPRLLTYAARHGLSIAEAVAALVTRALDDLDARAKGARRTNRSRTKAERSAAARHAVLARWAKRH